MPSRKPSSSMFPLSVNPEKAHGRPEEIQLHYLNPDVFLTHPLYLVFYFSSSIQEVRNVTQ